MIELLTLQEAKDHVRVTASNADSDIQFKIVQASAILLNYLKVPMDATVDDSPPTLPWLHTDFLGGHTTEGVPPWDIKAAAALIFGELYWKREGGEANPLSDTVKALLTRYRDPAMA